MKKYFLLSMIMISFSTFVFGQSEISDQAKTKVDSLKALIHLTRSQVNKLMIVETRYLNGLTRLHNNQSYCNAQAAILEQKRLASYKKILSRRQYTQFQLIEKKLLQKPPVWFTE